MYLTLISPMRLKYMYIALDVPAEPADRAVPLHSLTAMKQSM